LAISEHFTVNPHKSLIVALSFNFARHRHYAKPLLVAGVLVVHYLILLSISVLLVK